jgi:hypothetical protein
VIQKGIRYSVTQKYQFPFRDGDPRFRLRMKQQCSIAFASAITTSQDYLVLQQAQSEDSILLSLILLLTILLDILPYHKVRAASIRPALSLPSLFLGTSRFIWSYLITRHNANAAEIFPGINHHHHHAKDENETAWKEVEGASSFSNDASLQDASKRSHAQRGTRLFGPGLRVSFHGGI